METRGEKERERPELKDLSSSRHEIPAVGADEVCRSPYSQHLFP